VKTRFKMTSLAILVGTLLWASGAYAVNQVLGEVQIQGVNKVAKTSGVWVDGRYVGYVKELNGDKKLLLLPGDHVIAVRQSGYQDFERKVLVEPGKKQTIQVAMQKDFGATPPKITSEIKLNINPDRAAVFVDNAYVGHVSEFSGLGRGMLLSPGTHRIKIDLPGYRTFETEITLLPNQKYTVKTDLARGSITQASSLINGE
jgi:PEGA domain